MHNYQERHLTQLTPVVIEEEQCLGHPPDAIHLSGRRRAAEAAQQPMQARQAWSLQLDAQLADEQRCVDRWLVSISWQRRELFSRKKPHCSDLEIRTPCWIHRNDGQRVCDFNRRIGKAVRAAYMPLNISNEAGEQGL